MSHPDSALPDGWATTTLGAVCLVNPHSFAEPVQDDSEISFVPMAAVEAGTGRMDSTRTRPYRDIRSGYTRFSEGDVLFAKITPSMENGKVAIARGLTNGSGCGSTEFHVLRPLSGISRSLLRSSCSRLSFEVKRAVIWLAPPDNCEYPQDSWKRLPSPSLPSLSSAASWRRSRGSSPASTPP